MYLFIYLFYNNKAFFFFFIFVYLNFSKIYDIANMLSKMVVIK